MVYSAAANLVAVGLLTLAMVLRNVDDEVKGMVVYHVHHIANILVTLVRPAYRDCRDAIVCQELCRSLCSIDGIAALLQRDGRVEQSCLLLCAT